MWQEHFVTCGDKQPIHLPIYCTALPIKDHEPLRVSDSDDSIRPHVFKRANSVIHHDEIDFDQCELTVDSAGNEAWLVVTQVVMRRLGAELTFGWRVGGREELELGLQGDDEIHWTDFEKLKLCDGRSAPFAVGDQT